MNSLDRADLKTCHSLLRGGSRTFYAASFLLPRRIREPAAALYAFCRVADDAVDQGHSCEETLAGLRSRLGDIYSGRRLVEPADQAFAWVVRDFGIPRALPEALLEGFEWDIQRRAYYDLDDLQCYAVRVAGTVGIMMAMILGVRSPSLLARACELGMAMQLTNIARDVGEDAQAGRLYLPRRWLKESGIHAESWLQSPHYSQALGQVVQRLLNSADVLYENADIGIAGLPIDCQPGIRCARLIYAEIGRDIERYGMDSVSRRAVVSGKRKLQLIYQALNGKASQREPELLPVPEPARFLIEAVSSALEPPTHTPQLVPVAWWEFSKRVAWTFDLFDRLDQRERAGVDSSR